MNELCGGFFATAPGLITAWSAAVITATGALATVVTAAVYAIRQIKTGQRAPSDT